MKELRQSTLGFAVLGAGMIALAAAGLATQGATWTYWQSWAGVSGLIFAAQLIYLWRHLDSNRPPQGGELFPTLGAGNLVTAWRGVLLAGLGGLVLLPSPPGWAAWLPGLLYLGAAIMDLFDGYAARVSGRVSQLGARLDMEWDTFGMLFGIGVAVAYGKIPAWYFLLGLARYAFILGIAWRERHGLAVIDLDDRMMRRALAGMQMGFIGVALLPIFQPPATTIAALIFVTPSLLHFWRDWQYVSGHFMRVAEGRIAANNVWARATVWSALGVRAALTLVLAAALVTPSVWQGEFLKSSAPLPVICAAMALVGTALGAAGRISGLAALLLGGLIAQGGLSPEIGWLLLGLGAAGMMLGSGAVALWRPEDGIILRRAGETRLRESHL